MPPWRWSRSANRMALPVPRRLSAGCGIAWRMEAEVYAQYQTVIADCGIEIEQSEAFVF